MLDTLSDSATCQVLSLRGVLCSALSSHRVTSRDLTFCVCAGHAAAFAVQGGEVARIACAHPSSAVRFDGVQLDENDQPALECFSCTACRMSFSRALEVAA